MYINVLKSKIHRVTITESCLDYIGSITIDEDIIDAAGIIPNEKVQIVDNNNGSRFETYVIPGERGSGVICVNGAAAHLVKVGDIIKVEVDKDMQETYPPAAKVKKITIIKFFNFL